MKTRTLAILSLGAAVLVGGATLAATSQAGNRGGNAGRGLYDLEQQGGMMGGGTGVGMTDRDMQSLMSAYDKNGDGKLTQEEVNAGRAARLGAFDTNGDGKLSLGEYKALWLDAMHSRMVDRFQYLDEDGNGLVTADEFTRPYSTLVRHMDTNGDGAMNLNDMNAMHEHVHGGQLGNPHAGHAKSSRE